jgi:stress response protein SCP2
VTTPTYKQHTNKASAICFDQSGVFQDAVYYNQLSIFNGALTHSGDSKEGLADGVDESIAVDVDTLPDNISYIVMSVSLSQLSPYFAVLLTSEVI